MSPDLQKALLYPAKAAPFELGTRPIPTPTEDQLLVKVESVALNPVDAVIASGGMDVVQYPAVLGSDIAGTVEKIGANVTRFSVGDQVFFQGWYRDSDQTGFQQYTIVPNDIVSRIPPNISVDQAASIPITLVAAFVGLFHSTGLGIPPPFKGPTVDGADSTILILGGSSSVGYFAIQLARLAGFKHILTTVSPSNNDYVKSIGATHVFDRSAPDVAEQIRAAAGVELVYIADAISAPETQKLGWELLSDTKPGALVVFRSPVQDDSSPKKPEGSRWVSVYGSSHVHREISVPLWGAVGKWVEEEKIVPPRVEVIGGLADIPAGIKRLGDWKVSGEKLVAHPWE
ncbi:hypothetical protein BOTBODRAFT_115316 [Botryobasidium botryosum FD-172 SS1]|uniref:Enoyl reductase (ER) domain-containing protein n=1 Tax=Botryobasidium botryosum (strain FD-172 SS1) TaxID=930990 RepID=A0A067M523_BOTB1|nr:hypothetical protein BOTBODRAFT_115316 [Botryobasidium botryosum FD-172 SS1]